MTAKEALEVLKKSLSGWDAQVYISETEVGLIDWKTNAGVIFREDEIVIFKGEEEWKLMEEETGKS